jgi:hypothetical protein
VTDRLPQASAYAQAGVDIAAGERAVDLIKPAVRSTWGGLAAAGVNGPRVLGTRGVQRLVALATPTTDPGWSAAPRRRDEAQCWTATTIGRDPWPTAWTTF